MTQQLLGHSSPRETLETCVRLAADQSHRRRLHGSNKRCLLSRKSLASCTEVPFLAFCVRCGRFRGVALIGVRCYAACSYRPGG